MRPSRAIALAWIAPFLLANSCAPGGARSGPPLLGPVTLNVQIRNECPDIVEVFFLGDTGARVRVGSVGPLQSDLFMARVVNPHPGRFVTRRRGSLPDGDVVLEGVVDPQAIRTGLVRVIIGPSGEFDRWTVGT